LKRLLSVIAGLLFPIKALAVSITEYGWDCTGFLYCGSRQDAVTTITTRVIGSIYNTIAVFAVITFMYGGIKMIVSRGEDGKEAGKKAIMYAAIGLAFAIVTFMGNRVLQYVIETVSTISTS
jgi:ABC-type uncharacterized transport system permease subunit